MTDYTELVKALRHCMAKEDGITICEPCSYYGKGIECENVLHTDAAAAIEALQTYIKQLKAANDELRESQTYIDHYGDRWMTSAKDVPTAAYEHGYADGRGEAEAQLPKRGEWIPYEFNTNGTWHKCSVCGVAYQYKDAPNSGWWINHKYCPNCGAKMEVQE